MSQPVEDDDDPLTIIISRTSTRTIVTVLPIPTTAPKENSSSTVTSATSTKTTDRITTLTSSTTSRTQTESQTTSPTETPTDSASPKSSGGNSAFTGPRIAGLVFGILAILALIGGAVFCFRRNRRKEKSGRSEPDGGREGAETVPVAIPLEPVRRTRGEDTDSESEVDIWDNPMPQPQPTNQPNQPRPDLLAPTPRTTAPKTYQPWHSTNPYMVPSRPQTRNENLPPAVPRDSSPSHQSHAGPSNPRGRPPVPAGYGPHWQTNNEFKPSPIRNTRSTAVTSSSINQPVVPVGNNPSWNQDATFRPRSTEGQNAQGQSLSEGLRIYRS